MQTDTCHYDMITEIKKNNEMKGNKKRLKTARQEAMKCDNNVERFERVF